MPASSWGCVFPRASFHALAVVCVLFASARAGAVELFSRDDALVEGGADLKGFGVATFPYEHPLLPREPGGRGLLDLRLKLDGALGDWLRVVVHPQLLWSMASPAGSSSGAVARLANLPEAVTLSHTLADGGGVNLQARLDRASVRARLGPVEVTAGRQAMSFGSTFFFTPLDIVSPFTPVVVDREYKPGIDALRVDTYAGTSSRLTLVAAYAGDFTADGMVFAGHARGTVWDVDVGVFAARVRGNLVLGMDTAGDAWGFGLRAEGTVTVPPDLRRPYVRATVGADRRFEYGLVVMGELYVQTLGGESPSEYVDVAKRPEFQRGEVWAMGRYYAAITGSYELSPEFTASVAIISNVADPSAIISPSVTWSLADNAVFVGGAYLGLGERPAQQLSADPAQPITLRSEYGSAPASAFVQFRLYL